MTPSASRHSTKTSDALRFATSAPYPKTGFGDYDTRNFGLTWRYSSRATLAQVVRRSLLAAILTLVLARPASAGAATRWVVKGGGWGHGIGMSQYGAYGMAQNGSNYREIIKHYYTGTEIGPAPSQTIRVLLQANRDQISFTGLTRAGGKKLNAEETYYARVKGARRRAARTARASRSARSARRCR